MHMNDKNLKRVLDEEGLRLFNSLLTWAVALLALYIIIMPFWPQISWWARHDSPLKGTLSGDVKPPDPVKTPASAAIPGLDQLLIPRLEMQETVHGGGIGALKKGVWRLPHTSTPDKGGNTVLVGHRFTYGGPAVFYHLNKVQKGDAVSLTWKGKQYNYRVTTIKVVPPTEVSVEANTKEPMLTIYTCTPLLTAKDRLVIQAEFVGESQ
jgi:LPXTG-site transpeptidase (sortase) family protein